ncbi:hypothetical protein BOX15_Mlig031060g1 [Macrostomum lignano]|uniref:Rho-GAP domain-containing protein n=1 Tax=Macrostomum lignano TaxID=282301 RepID=A0A267H2B1_9PLAT|nr:hypothetical protein BOX15_Mlig031060g1 [Macrostomum lignano]
MDPACELWLEHNVVASVLKRFLLQLPDPLIPAVYYNDFVSAQQLHEHSGRMLKLHRLLSMMEEHAEHPQHKCHRRTLQYLVGHLARVAQLSASNRMRVYNLAMVFAPSLFGQRAQETLVSDSAHLIGLTKAIIVYRDWLFADWQTADLSVPTQLDDQELDADPSAAAAASVDEADSSAIPAIDSSSPTPAPPPPPPPPPASPLQPQPPVDVEEEHRRILSVVRSLLADWQRQIGADSTAAASSSEASPVHRRPSTASLRRCASMSDEATQNAPVPAAAGAAASAPASTPPSGEQPL